MGFLGGLPLGFGVGICRCLGGGLNLGFPGGFCIRFGFLPILGIWGLGAGTFVCLPGAIFQERLPTATAGIRVPISRHRDHPVPRCSPGGHTADQPIPRMAEAHLRTGCPSLHLDRLDDPPHGSHPSERCDPRVRTDHHSRCRCCCWPSLDHPLQVPPPEPDPADRCLDQRQGFTEDHGSPRSRLARYWAISPWWPGRMQPVRSKCATARVLAIIDTHPNPGCVHPDPLPRTQPDGTA